MPVQNNSKLQGSNKPSFQTANTRKRPQTGRKDPEQMKDFSLAMAHLTKKKVNEGKNLILTDRNVNQMDKLNDRNPKGQLRREQIFDKFKKDNKTLAAEEASFKELEHCTFQPDTYDSKKNNNKEQRDLYEFLNDQQRFLEYKSIKSLKSKQDAIDSELKEVKTKPELDGLSVQLVNMMDDRKFQKTHDRLYAHGKEKIRTKNLEAVKNKQMVKRALSPTKALQSSSFHRGKPTQAALYDLHADILKHKEEVKRASEYDDYLKANTKFRNKQSDILRIEGFRKEFYQNLLEIKNREQMQQGQEPDNHVEPKEFQLDFNHVAVIMHQMGFLQSKLSNEQEDSLNDLYTLFKCSKGDQILAENLQNLLMVIYGQRDENFEVNNDISNTKWNEAGVYDEDLGLFYIRNGEHQYIQNHFKILRLNRLHQRKAYQTSQYAHKRAPQEPQYKPYLSPMTQQLAQERRQKLYHAPADHKIDVVTVLLHPNNVKGDIHRMEMVKKEMRDKEEIENTFQPQTLNKRNIEIFQGDRQSVTGDRNQDLYLKSKQKEKKNKTSNEYWEERQADECKFHPDTNKTKFTHGGYIPDTVYEVRDVDKQMNRIIKARQDREFKKMMTQRSGYSPTKGLKKARNQLKDSNKFNDSVQFRTQAEGTKHQAIGATKKNPLRQSKDSQMRQSTLSVKTKPTKKTRKSIPPPQYEMNNMDQADEVEQQQEEQEQDLLQNQEIQEEQSPMEQDSPDQDPEMDEEKDLVDQQLNDIGDRIDEPDPKLYVDVNVGKNKMERIVVYEGDTAESLANKFCETHKLDKNMYDKLITLLDQQIAGVLPKIMEDEDMDDSEDQVEA